MSRSQPKLNQPQQNLKWDLDDFANPQNETEIWRKTILEIITLFSANETLGWQQASILSLLQLKNILIRCISLQYMSQPQILAPASPHIPDAQTLPTNNQPKSQQSSLHHYAFEKNPRHSEPRPSAGRASKAALNKRESKAASKAAVQKKKVTHLNVIKNEFGSAMEA